MMTANKHFKQLVRARMAATGESYSKAHEAIRLAAVDIAFGEPVVADVHGRHGQTVAFTPDGTRLLSGGQDARIAILDARSGVAKGELVGHTKVVNALAMRAGGGAVVSVSSDKTVRLWDLNSRRELAVLDGHRDAVVALDIAPDDSTALTGGYDGRVRLWDLDQRTCRHEWSSDLERIAALVYAPGGAAFVEAGQGPMVRVRDLETGSPIAALETSSPAVTGLAVAADGSMLAAAGYDGIVRVWDCDDWALVRELRAGERANAVAFARSGHLLAAAAKKRLFVWDPHRDEPVADTTLPIAGVYALAFSPDGGRLAQTGADGKVRIWTVR